MVCQVLLKPRKRNAETEMVGYIVPKIRVNILGTVPCVLDEFE